MITKLKLSIAEQSSREYLKGQITNPVSQYQPNKETVGRTMEINRKFSRAYEIMHKPYEEFNNRSLLEEMSECQKYFNNYRPAKSNDPAEQWKSNAVRPIIRNRAISIAAHTTGTLIKPQVFAQNEQQQADKDASTVMRGLLEWANDQANYVQTFVYAVIASLVNPATIIHTEYAENYRLIKEIKDISEGQPQYEEKKVIDEINSGFNDCIVPLDEFFISDIRENNIQKQPYLIWRKVMDYSVALAKYGDNMNFLNYVRPGLQIVYDQSTEMFYEVYDDNLAESLVEEIIYYDRAQDLEIRQVNGVMMDNPDRPNPRQDKKYPFVKGGYELIDEGKFFYYFSLVRKMKDDAEIINTLYRMVIDGTFLRLMPPQAVFGDENINSAITTPGTVVTFREGTRLQGIDVGSDLGAGYRALDKMEASLSESSNDILQSGMSITGSQTAFEISRLEQNARIMLGLFGKMIGFMVKEWGELRIGDILQHLTVGEVSDIVGEEATVRYKSFLLPDQIQGGKKQNYRVLMSDIELPQNELEASYDALAVAGGAQLEDVMNMPDDVKEQYIAKAIDGDVKLFIANPRAFRQLKYKIIVRPDIDTPHTENVKKALNIELFDRAINLPFANQEALYRDLLLGSYEKTRDDTDKYVIEKKPLEPLESLESLGLGGLGGAGLEPGRETARTARTPRTTAENPLNKIFGTGNQGRLNMAVGTNTALQ